MALGSMKEHSRLLSDLERETLFHDQDLPHPSSALAHRHRRTSIALLISLIFNAIFVGSFFISPEFLTKEDSSEFAGLSRTVEEPYVLQTPYISSNESLQTKLWHDIDIDAGVVALSDSFAAGRGLRLAQRFPWDTTGGIYILHGFHNLHCVKIIHMSLDEYRTGAPQSRHWEHISHCIDALRRQVMCDADDTPRTTERRKEVVSEIGQHRKCRSWKALEAWARQRTACYQRPKKPEDEVGMKRFEHCPEDSSYIVNDRYEPTDELLVGLPEESIQTIQV